MLARAVRLAAQTRLGYRVAGALIRARPEIAVETLGPLLNRPPRFADPSRWPERLDGFEDMAFLFASGPLNYGLALLRLDEAALLWRLVRDRRPRTLVEIGRFKGGATFLLASAMPEDAHVYSYDLHVKLASVFDPVELDRELAAALAHYGLAERVHLIVADSRSAEYPPLPVDLLFLDGDHSYEGVHVDFRHWRSALASGASVLFHDATSEPGVREAVQDLAGDHRLERVRGAGTIAAFLWRP